MSHVEERGKQVMLFFENAKKTLMDDMNEHFRKTTGIAYTDIEVGYTMHQIFSLLSFIHYKDFVHRDIKPENFVLIPSKNMSNNLRLANLSTMASMADSESLKGVVGTYLYMAPEIILGKSYDKAADMWSAGIILYMMMTGEHPLIELESKSIRSEPYKNLLHKEFAKQDLKPVDDSKAEVKLLKKNVRMLLESLLELDPKKRITAERALRDPWIIQCQMIKRQESLVYIEREIRKKEDLHDMLMAVVSILCAPLLKVMLLDRMCNPCSYARENNFPEVDQEILQFYRSLFYMIDTNGNGFISKNEIMSFRDQFPKASLSKSEIAEMLSHANFNTTKEYAISPRSFEHAAALYDIQHNKSKLNAIFSAIDTVFF